MGGKMSANVTGALLMLASMFCFTANDALIKLTDGALPLAQLLFLRGVLASGCIYLLARRFGHLRFDVGAREWRLIGLRCLAETAAAWFFLTALMNMPLANVTAILQALPLTVTLGAALFFHDPVGWRRAMAIAVGFTGMLLIVRPGAQGFSFWSIYALIAVFCVTARDLVTRRLPPSVPSLLVTFVTSLSVTVVFGLLSLTQDWQGLTPGLTSLILGAAALIVGGYYLSVQVMRQGDISFVAPFRYSGLVYALVIGWLAFDHWPDPLTLLGAAIVVAAGLFAFYREATLRKS